MADHCLWTLASSPQPGGVVEHGWWLAHVTVQVQWATLTASQVEFSSWSVSVKGRGLGEWSWRVSGERVWSGACGVGMAKRGGPQTLGVLRLIGVTRCSKWQGGLSCKAQWAVSLDRELGRVAAELFIVLDDVCI